MLHKLMPRSVMWFAGAVGLLIACRAPAAGSASPTSGIVAAEDPGEATAASQVSAPSAAGQAAQAVAQPPPELAAGHDCPESVGGERPTAACLERSTGEIKHPKLEFEFNKDTIRPASYAALDELATLILAHPEVAEIEVAGHHASNEEHHY